jgi:galactokinase
MAQRQEWLKKLYSRHTVGGFGGCACGMAKALGLAKLPAALKNNWNTQANFSSLYVVAFRNAQRCGKN